MAQNITIGFIGYGNMAQAMVKVLLLKEVLPADQIYACAKNWEKLERTTGSFGVHPCHDAREVAEQADLVVYAGFLTILDEQVVDAFPGKMMNIHPALIPSFCGKGFYGLHVHEAVLQSGVKLTGATVHFVTADCDAGPIIAQKAVPVLEGDTPEVLQRRVMEQCEWQLLPQAVALFCQDKIQITGNKTRILD